jgi:polysaccharide biosynthesis protein PslG
MDRRVLAAIGALIAVVVVVGLIFALRNGDDDDDTVAVEPTPAAQETPDTTPVSGETPTAEQTTDDAEPADEPAENEDEEGEPQPEPTSPPPPPPMSPGGEPQRASGEYVYGFNIAWRADEDGGEFNSVTRQAVDDAGFNWVRFQVHWHWIERQPGQWDPAPIDRMVDTYADSNIRILITVVGAPDWARDPSGERLLANYDDFAGVMHFLAERYRGRVHAWEIWLEQNIADNWGGSVRVEDYARLLEAGYNGVKQVDPEALVVFGGLAPTGVNDPALAVDELTFLDQFYTLGDRYFMQFYDVLAVQLNATNNPPHTMWPDEPGPGEWSNDGSFYFRRGEQIQGMMAMYNDNSPVWITEFGWTTANPVPGYEYGFENSEEDQATYLVRAFEWASAEWPWVTGMFVWNLNFSTLVPEDDEKHHWSALRSDWSPRPAYWALQQMPKR